MPIVVWNYKVVFTLVNPEGDTTKKIKNMWVKNKVQYISGWVKIIS
jgi:hypothetical protein